MFCSRLRFLWYFHFCLLVNTSASFPSPLFREALSRREVINRLCPLINNTFSCGSVSPYCSCAPETCMAYGDCCYDVAFKTPEIEIRRLKNIKNKRNETSCVTLPGMPNAVKMITSCLPNTDNITSMECFNAGRTTNIDPKRDLPVWSKTSRLVYRNLYCAFCHNDTDIEPWLLNFHCDSPDIIDSLPRNSTDKLSLLRQIVSLPSCSILFKHRSRMGGDMHVCRTNASKNSDNITIDFSSVDLWYEEWMAQFQPFEYEVLIQTCNVTGLWEQYDDNERDQCEAYSQWVVSGLPPRLYSTTTTSSTTTTMSTTELTYLPINLEIIPDNLSPITKTFCFGYCPDKRSKLWSTFGLFANPHCATCNGIILEKNSLICPQIIHDTQRFSEDKELPDTGGIQPFSMLMDFGPDFQIETDRERNIQERCPAGYTKRQGYEECRKVICPAGMIPSGTDCIDQFPEINLNCSFKVPVKLYAFSIDATHPVLCKDLIYNVSTISANIIPDEVHCTYTEDKYGVFEDDAISCRFEPQIIHTGIIMKVESNGIKTCSYPFLITTHTSNESSAVYITGSAIWKGVSSSVARQIESRFSQHLRMPWEFSDLNISVVTRHGLPEKRILLTGTWKIEINSSMNFQPSDILIGTERYFIRHILLHFEALGMRLMFFKNPEISFQRRYDYSTASVDPRAHFTNVSFVIGYQEQSVIRSSSSLETSVAILHLNFSNVELLSLATEVPFYMQFFSFSSKENARSCFRFPCMLCISFESYNLSFPKSKAYTFPLEQGKPGSGLTGFTVSAKPVHPIPNFDAPRFVENKDNRHLPNVSKISEDTLNCGRVRLNRSEFTEDDNMITLSVNGLILSQTDFIKDGEGVLICVDVYLKEKRNRTPESSSVLVQVIVSYSLLSLSVLCLVFTIITYLLFTDLRKGLPGKNSFNLCVTLMLAQLLFLLNYVPSQNNAVCKVFAIVMHYWWLCSFAWMTACAFHMCWTFTYPFSIAQFDSSDIRKWHIIYCLISYCSPLVIVIPCVVLDFCECSSVSIGYGTGGSSCWIGNTMALAYSFALPVGITILLQLGFFIRTAIALRPVPNVERCGPDYNQFLVYCKLSTLMGFGWIFAFIAAFTSLSFMWYLFYVFSCLQGAFICFSYIMKKSVLQRYRNYCRNKSPGHISSTTNMSMTTLTSAKNARSATYITAPEVAV
ncbi:uncharacterized protein LOC106155269 [Lingula anatina]|uniref:Uncharacterized protein LOC106155269 n=1 Tax=Lingula anatina TaxID=7574 RepID=A0A1S3HJ31_LINAN|nr:uncharacterized protein LOC106155269 [Lingula anatina]|eukprot:XP_013385466.1 uncharacterized protein LOC106155269 [Lingula anatina]